jgi:hypothetical protein
MVVVMTPLVAVLFANLADLASQDSADVTAGLVPAKVNSRVEVGLTLKLTNHWKSDV